ncbi:MAG: cyclic nucleotide-binding domain-containing protein [Gammaproteobacteria bacterium]
MNTLNLFKNADNVEEYPAGATIFEQGQPGRVMYVVLEGEVEIRAHGQAVNKLGPGDLLGEMALIDSGPRSASAMALSRCRLAPVDEKRFLFMVQQSPFFAVHVMRELAHKLRFMTDKA